MYRLAHQAMGIVPVVCDEKSGIKTCFIEYCSNLQQG